MAESEARREARRRRILENSLNRLNRITGGSSAPQLDEEPIRDSLFGNEYINLQASTVETPPSVTHASKGAVLHDDDTFDGIDNHIISDGATFERDFMSNLFQNMRTEEATQPSEAVAQSRLHRFVSTKLDVVLFSLLIQAVYSFDSSFVSSVPNLFVPLLIFNVTKHFLLPPQEKSGVISALLVINGVSPTKVKNFMIAVQILYNFLKDVAIYIFVIVLSQVVWNNARTDTLDQISVHDDGSDWTV